MPMSPRSRCAPLPLAGRGIAYGFGWAIALERKKDSEDGSLIGRALDEEVQEGVWGACRTRAQAMQAMNCWKLSLSRWRRSCSGAGSCAEMEEFGRSKEGLLRLFLRLEHGILSHDTFSRVFRLLKPQAFEFAFRRFMAAFAKANGLKFTGVIAVDGKALRRAYERGGRAAPLHLVNVFAVEARMALAQQKAPGRNETAGALEVLDLLLEDCTVTADALHCHREFAAAVLDRGGQYVLTIKANRGPLFKTVTQQFARSGQRSSAQQADHSAHDRSEVRRATVMRNTSLAERFPGVAAVGRVTSRRRLRGQRADLPVVRHYLLSRYISPKRLPRRHPKSLGRREPGFTGCWTSILPRTETVPARTTRRRISPFSAAWPSTSYEVIPTASPSTSRSGAQDGTTPTSCRSSAICDSPALAGRAGVGVFRQWDSP